MPDDVTAEVVEKMPEKPECLFGDSRPSMMLAIWLRQPKPFDEPIGRDIDSAVHRFLKWRDDQWIRFVDAWYRGRAECPTASPAPTRGEGVDRLVKAVDEMGQEIVDAAHLLTKSGYSITAACLANAMVEVRAAVKAAGGKA